MCVSISIYEYVYVCIYIYIYVYIKRGGGSLARCGEGMGESRWRLSRSHVSVSRVLCLYIYICINIYWHTNKYTCIYVQGGRNLVKYGVWLEESRLHLSCSHVRVSELCVSIFIYVYTYIGIQINKYVFIFRGEGNLAKYGEWPEEWRLLLSSSHVSVSQVICLCIHTWICIRVYMNKYVCIYTKWGGTT